MISRVIFDVIKRGLKMGITKEQAYENIKVLVERFDEHIDEYKKGNYNETLTRIDFIDPFFKALGWDMNNEQEHSESYRDVIHEDKIKIGSSTKAPDYSFTLLGQRKFFVDAKKPAINIKDNLSPAYQVRRYGWSAKVPISIVTDFEEFAIYDCTKKPNPTDKASVSRIKYITYKQYLEEFDFIWEIFAKENLPKGRFDKYVQSDTRKKGTTTVDDEFLKSIEQWRLHLARNIALRNKSLSVDEINYAVQKIIDRIIFLRMCEDRGIELYGNLKKAIERDGVIYQNLFDLYYIADDKYNSGLFDFKKDKITPSLNVDNKVMRDIVEDLYYPKCEYEFSVMPADILGSVYERFLGKTIRLTKAHLAKIEEKPEVRKAGGVYYTPKYIVDYIVENTVGSLIEGKTPRQVEKIKICDPACGSGSFLIGAYQFLLDWHLKYYTANPSKKKKNNPLTPNKNLTTAEKKRILTNNIFGIDIDAQAVEVSKLNLLLKALEGETKASINHQLTLFHERVLPNLDQNIKCGNSLISSDFYDDQLDLFPELIKNINAFDWEEGFPEIFKNGGFNAIIGNPPYLSMEDMEQLHRDYYYGNDNNKVRYITAMNKSNLYSIFFERSITLASKGALIGLITPYSWLSNSSFTNLRKIFITETTIKTMHFFPVGVFQDAGIATGIIILNKLPPKNSTASVFDLRAYSVNELPQLIYNRSEEKNIPIDVFRKATDYIFNISWNKRETPIFDKIRNNPTTLGDLVHIDRGCDPANTIKYTGYQYIEDRNSKRLLSGQCFDRFSHNWDGQYLYYEPKKMKAEKSTARPGKPDRFECDEKLIVYRFLNHTKGFICTYDNEQFYCLSSCYVLHKKAMVTINVHYLAGILNSKLISFYNSKLFNGTKITITEMARIPIPIDNKEEKDIIDLVKKLIELNTNLQNIKLETQRIQILRIITHTEEKIDAHIYKLYGLTKEEIIIVENS